jgi:hypothetical protein
METKKRPGAISVSPDSTVLAEFSPTMTSARLWSWSGIVGVLSNKDILDEVIVEDEKIIKQLETERLMTTGGQY